MNSTDQKFPVASRKIPTPHPACKKDIPSKERVVGSIKKTNAAGAVSGNLKEINGMAQNLLLTSFLEQKITSHRLHLEVDAESTQEIPISQHVLGCCMHGDTAAVNPGDLRCIPDMVVMTMGQEKKGDGRVAKCFGCPLGCIHQQVAFRAGQKIGIGFQGSSGEHFHRI